MAEKEKVEKDEPRIPPKLRREDETDREKITSEQEPVGSMVGATVLVKNPHNQWNPAIVLEDHGGNFKLVAFWDSGQRMGMADVIVIPDAQPLPLDADDEETARPWVYWRAI